MEDSQPEVGAQETGQVSHWREVSGGFQRECLLCPGAVRDDFLGEVDSFSACIRGPSGLRGDWWSVGSLA